MSIHITEELSVKPPVVIAPLCLPPWLLAVWSVAVFHPGHTAPSFHLPVPCPCLRTSAALLLCCSAALLLVLPSIIPPPRRSHLTPPHSLSLPPRRNSLSHCPLFPTGSLSGFPIIDWAALSYLQLHLTSPSPLPLPSIRFLSFSTPLSLRSLHCFFFYSLCDIHQTGSSTRSFPCRPIPKSSLS